MHCLRKPKGITARARARKKRTDDAYALMIREQVFARDGMCRYGFDVSPAKRSSCLGPIEWAHFGEKKRFKTRGMAPAARHLMVASLALCAKHHDDYDDGRLDITARDPEAGCNGPLDYREEERTRGDRTAHSRLHRA